MNNFRNELNSNEKLARQVVGTDTNAIFTVDGERADEILKREKASKFNEQVDAMDKKLESYMQSIEDEARKLEENKQVIDIVPMYTYVLIRPFKHNPFQQVKIDKKSGLIVDLGGLTPEYKSEEDGQIHEEQEAIKAGLVIETGHRCEFLKSGDIVFYNDMTSSVPVPYYKLGLVAVSEQRILAVVNDGVTARKDKFIEEHGTK